LAHSKGAIELLAALSPERLDTLCHDWLFWARSDQLPPVQASNGRPWTTWLVLGGRGAGKTRTGAEWVRGLALGRAPFAARPVSPIALIAETYADLREVMVEGVSGLMSVHANGERPEWQVSRRRLVWPNGAVAQGFSAEDPESLRGPQFAAAWADEVGKWKQADAAFDMLQFGLRLGSHPRQVVTTTPRSIPLLRRLAADPTTVVTVAATYRNAGNLAPDFLSRIVGRYAGTRLGRQELDGEFIEDNPDTLFPRALIEKMRVDKAPDLERIVVAVDPPAGGRRAGGCGIVAAGLARGGDAYVLEDATIEGARPDIWAARALDCYRRHEADALIAEINQGGDMVAEVLRSIDAGVPVTPVRATRGKRARAEPVAALYAQGRVHHVGALPALEDEMAAFGPDGLSGGRSPDRLDALVWAITALALDREGTPRLRRLLD
jgi:phage terminase large subunit-like protein